MSQVSAIYGSSSPEEINDRLYLLLNTTGGLGLIHEAINHKNSSDYTRPWFAWANSYFAEMLLDLGERMPGSIFKEDTPYYAGQQ
jgi:meiotically up-regulated gene 157 (Mug157) protein